METKLTLKLNQRVIKNAKLYAVEKKTSVSKIVERYLEKLSDKNGRDIKITPRVKKLSGILKLSGDYDFKKEYKDHIQKKY